MIVRIIKLVISILFWIFDSFFNTTGRILGKKRKGSCIVLYYHAILKEHREKFSRQMDIFKRLITPVAVENHNEIKTGMKYGSITFDDGFVCVIDNAVPELVKRNIPFTIFIPTGYLEQRPQWMKDNEKYSNEYNLMSPGQLMKLNKLNLVSIGSHSCTHRNFLKLSTEEVKKEFINSKKILEQILDNRIDLFSFPYGAINHEHIAIAKQAGYKRVFSITPVPTNFDKNEFVIGRTLVEPTDLTLEFRLKILGAYRWLPAAFKVKRWLKHFFQ